VHQQGCQPPRGALHEQGRMRHNKPTPNVVSDLFSTKNALGSPDSHGLNVDHPPVLVTATESHLRQMETASVTAGTHLLKKQEQ